MITGLKRLFALVLVLTLVMGLLPAGNVRAEEAQVISDAAYADADLVLDGIDEVLSAPAKKDGSTLQKVWSALQVVASSDSYVEGSLELSGASFTWMTDSGIRCIYSPRMRKIREAQKAQGIDAIVNEPVATKGGSPTGKQVYLIGPYYGYDENFTDQYKKEARRVAAALGDTDGYTLYSGNSATIDKVAEAISNGAVVFFDSHGATDYENPNNEYDCSTKATTSYLCLHTATGLTTQDYNDGAAYDGNAYVTGKTIANHMTKNSPSGLLWMAICLGMATDSLYKPMREMGVEVVYGYSESVTFYGDYLWEETFWEKMLDGSTMAQAVAAMKETWGYWDWSGEMAQYYGYNYYQGYTTISEARDDFSAFPVVVSDEDTWPGKRTTSSYGASSLQTVKSTYTLGELQQITTPTDPRQILEEAYALYPGEELPYTPTLTGTVTQITTAYSSQYGNITVIMEVEDCEDLPIKCYRLQGSGVEQIAVGDRITVTGTITNYQHSSGDTEVEFTQGCELLSRIPAGEVPDEPEEPAPEESYTVSFVVPQGVAAVDTMICTGSITLPTADAPTGYSFAGWAESAVSTTDTKPNMYTGTYSALENITLYAVYSYTEGTGSSNFTLVTDAAQLVEGNKVIIAAKDAAYAMSTTQNNNNRAATAITKTGNTLSNTGSAVILELRAGQTANTYAFYDANKNGYLYAASSTKNYLRTESALSANSSWKITIASDGTASVIAQGSNTRNTMQYNNNSTSNLLFSCYASASEQPVSIYMKGSATVYYTSLDAAVAVRVQAGENYYATLTEALQDTSADYITLLEDISEHVIADRSFTLDLNGHILEGDVELATDAFLYLFDSATADYTAQNRGGIMGNIRGNLVTVMNTPASYGHNYRYLTVMEEEGLYTAHRIYLAVQSVNLIPGNTGISYKTVFKCNDVVAQYVESYGVEVEDQTYTLTTTPVGGTNTGVIHVGNILDARNLEATAANAATKITLTPLVVMKDDLQTRVYASHVSYCLMDVVKMANQSFSALSVQQQHALQYMYAIYASVMDSWDDAVVGNIRTKK